MDKIRLVLFEDKFGIGGIEKFIYNVCLNIDLKKYDISLVVVNKTTDYYDDLLKKLGIRIIVLLPKNELNPIKRFKNGLPAFRAYLRNNKDNCDIIHFNLSDSIDLLYVRIAKQEGIKIRIVHSHNSSATNLKKKLAHKVGKIFLVNEPNYFITCSKKAAKWLFPRKVYNENKYLFLQNAISVKDYHFNPKKRQKIRKQYNLQNNIVYGEVARFNRQKNHKFLIEVFKNIKDKQPNAKLVLIGDGELLPEIKEQVNRYNLTDSVLFIGVSDRVADFLQAFDVFLLPSLYEGLPFVLIESQAASLQALVSDTITKEVKLTNYINFASLNMSAIDWAEKAIKLSKKNRSISDRTLENSEFDIKNMVKKLDEFYNEIINKSDIGEKN